MSRFLVYELVVSSETLLAGVSQAVRCWMWMWMYLTTLNTLPVSVMDGGRARTFLPR